MIFLPPHLLLQAADSATKKGIELPKQIVLATGGSSISVEQMENVRNALPGVLVVQCYGQTEISGTITRPSIDKVEDLMRIKTKPGSCGATIEGIWYKVCYSKCFFKNY